MDTKRKFAGGDMMKCVWAGFCSLVFSMFAIAANPQVDFRTSKLHGFLNFAETVAGDPHRSPSLKQFFDNHPVNTVETRKAIEGFIAARRLLDNGWTHPGFPAERHAGQNLDKFFLIQGAFSRSLTELSERTLGMLPMADHTKYFQALSVLYPVYEKTIWNPNEKRLTAYVRRLQDKAKAWGLSRLFGKAKKFYRANWPENLPFVVSVYPIPGKTGTTNAEQLGSFLSVGVMVDGTDFEGDFGVVFHEICESVFFFV